MGREKEIEPEEHGHTVDAEEKKLRDWLRTVGTLGERRHRKWHTTITWTCKCRTCRMTLKVVKIWKRVN